MGLFKAKTPEHLIRTLEGHSGPVAGCAISPDDTIIASASEDRTVKIWDVASGALRMTLSGHEGGVSGCEIAPDGSFVVSFGPDDIRIWDMPAGTERLRFSGYRALDCAVGPDGSFVVSAGLEVSAGGEPKNWNVKIWDVATGQERKTLEGHTSPIQCCAISPDGSYVIAGSVDLHGYSKGGDASCIKVWDVSSGWVRMTLTGVDQTKTPKETHTLIHDCAISSDGSLIASVSLLGSVQIWNAATGDEVRRWTAGSEDEFLVCCALSRDGILVTGRDMVKLWDVETARHLATFDGHHVKGRGGNTRDVAISSDGSFVVSAGHDQTLKIWDATAAHAR